MSRQRCFACGSDWNELFDCRLMFEGDHEDWLAVTVCVECWKSWKRQQLARLAEQEHQLLASWPTPVAAGEETNR